jgi:hypothetical protein
MWNRCCWFALRIFSRFNFIFVLFLLRTNACFNHGNGIAIPIELHIFVWAGWRQLIKSLAQLPILKHVNIPGDFSFLAQQPPSSL